MNVGRFEEKGSTILADTSPLCKNNQKSIGKSWNKGKPAILTEGGVVVITMKSGGHRRGLLISTKH